MHVVPRKHFYETGDKNDVDVAICSTISQIWHTIHITPNENMLCM